MTVINFKFSAFALIFVVLLQFIGKSKGFDLVFGEDQRIVGGSPAKLGQFPWRVSLVSGQKGTNQGKLCGATILSSRWILTAAHCVFDKPLTSWTHTVRAGSLQAQSGGQAVTVSRIVTHANFDSTTYANDIALLYLSQDLKFSSNVAAACLPSKFKGQNLSGSVAASGWGRTSENGSDDSSLMWVNLAVITNSECAAMMKKIGVTNPLTSNQLCTYQPGKDECVGDSGGSVDYKDNTGKYYAVGIISYGWGCAQSGHPALHTRLTEYISWIESQSGVSNFCGTRTSGDQQVAYS